MYQQAILWLPRVGEFASLGAALCWAFALCIFRKYGSNIPPYSLNLLKNIVGLSSFALTLLVLQLPFPRSGWVVSDLVLSGVMGLAISDTLLFIALKIYGPQLASAMLCLAPPFAAIIAAIFLGEQLSIQEIIGMVVVTIGVSGAIIAGTVKRRKKGEDRPKRNWKVIWLLLIPMSHATAMVLARNALPQTSVIWGTTLRLVPGVVLLVCWMAFKGDYSPLRWITKNPKISLRMAGSAFVGTFLGLMMLSVGLTYAKAGVTTALSSTYPLWVIPLAAMINKESVRLTHVLFTGLAIFGIAIMVLKF